MFINFLAHFLTHLLSGILILLLPMAVHDTKAVNIVPQNQVINNYEIKSGV